MVERARAVLVVDDEIQTRRVIARALHEIADRVVEAATGEAAIDLAAAEQPELIVLDLGLPDCEGIDICRELRGWSRAPIIVLSSRHGEEEKVALLMAGADDYVTKPFSLREFVARVHVQLRRINEDPDESLGPIEIDGVRIDLAARDVTRNGKAVHLTKTEWKLLMTLISQPGRILTHQSVFDAVWGRRFANASQHLRVHIWHLRRKVEPDPLYPVMILTEAGVGYRFVLPKP